MKKYIFNFFAALSACFALMAQPTATLQSPDKKLTFTFYQKEANGASRLFYTVTYKDKPVINESLLDIHVTVHFTKVENIAAAYSTNLKVAHVSNTTVDTSWTPVYGERNLIRDNYNAMNIDLSGKENSTTFVLQVRAYNEGIAFRYYFPETPAYHNVVAENTEFSMPEGTLAYTTTWAQGPYNLVPLKNWDKPVERPMPLILPNGLFVCLTEAQMTDYSNTRFRLHSTKPSTIVTDIYSPVDLVTAASSPWRVIMVAEKPGQLVENNYIIQNLNTPTRIADLSWIKPGKIMREVTLTTNGATSCIDFAAAHNLQYILFDGGWYGTPFSFSSDARKVVAPIDMAKAVEYGKQKGVGVFLYINLQATYAQMDSIFPLYHQWGIKGVKIGFVNTGSHRWTTWIQTALKKAADNHLLVNIHDEFRPTGEQRTWPNLLTAEGIRGNEEFPDASNNVIHPFARLLCGPGDYTICYYDKRIKTTHAHQLAMAAVYYSPLQTLFWYDKPSFYGNEPEVEFFEKIPTVWDETHVLDAVIGQYVSIARRSGEQWFVGTMTNNDGRNVKLSLNFLPKGKTYLATIYSDDPTVATKTKVKLETIKVNSTKVLDVQLLPSGGQAMWIRPE
jgi:alpha-glucosidase